MRVAELFYSIQGEGKLMGLPSVFVRTSGCNLRCAWCDTPYASWNPQGQELNVPEIVRRVRAFPCSHVVLTGGEPVIMPEIHDLCDALKANGYHLTLETAATVYKPLAIDLASLSPKLANSTPWQRDAGRHAQSHEQHRLRPRVIQQFIDAGPDFQLKFVVSGEADLAEIDQVLSQVTGWTAGDVLLMPEGTDAATLTRRGQWIAEICKARGFRYCPRLHIELFGNRKGT